MNKMTLLIVAVLAALYVLFSSIFVVNERDQAIVTRFGEITRVYKEPGLYFKIPTDIVESVQIIEDRLLRYDLEDITLQVSDGKFYNVDAFVTYRIADPVLFRESLLGSISLAEQRINTRFESALRQVYGLRNFSAALSAERSDMMREARDLIRAGVSDLGIDIVDVRVVRTDLTRQVSTQTFERMKAERLAEAAGLRAKGQELAQTLRAAADREAIRITADANKQSEILRGEGEGERNRVFAEAFSKDPEFFEFYRSLQSYRFALGGDGTSLVLSPNSDFFSYFGDSNPMQVSPQAVVSAPEANTAAAVVVLPEADTAPGADISGAVTEPVATPTQ